MGEWKKQRIKKDREILQVTKHMLQQNKKEKCQALRTVLQKNSEHYHN